MPLDPQTRALLELGAALPTVESLTPAEARAGMEQRARLTAGPPQAVAEVRELRVPGPASEIPVRVYVPSSVTAGAAPALIFFHGGGWVAGSFETHDVPCRALANGGGCIVLAVEYRCAPEHKFPAAIDDAEAVTRWVIAHATDLGVDLDHIAVGGDSAGGNLAAVVALALRDQLAFQLLIYPVTDHNLDTDSYRRNGEGYRLTRAAMRYYWDHYLGAAADGDDVRASPLRARDLSNAPPALVVTAEFDPLLDEGRAYADRLRDAGVQVEYREYAGLVHGFIAQGGVVDRARDAVDELATALGRALSAVPA
jgi:acetyl esterase